MVNSPGIVYSFHFLTIPVVTLPPAVAPGAYPGVGVRREGGAGPAHSQGAGGADESPPVQEGEGQVAAGADH